MSYKIFCIFCIGWLVVPYVTKVLVWEYLIRGKIKDHEGIQKKYAIRLREDDNSMFKTYERI